MRYTGKMETRPPSSQLLLPPLPQSWKESDLGPLASLVKDMTDIPSGDYFSEGQFVAIAAFAGQVEFDPNALVPVKWGEAKTTSLLNLLLSKVPHAVPKTPVKWPATLEELGGVSFPENASPHPAEWLAAMLLAKGADPWAYGEVEMVGSSQAGKVAKWGYPTVNAPIFQALRCAMVGLADRMLQMPGAPSIERLAHDPTQWMSLPLRDSAAVHESWLHRVSAEASLLPVLEWFLDKGVKPRPESQFHPLEHACPEALEVFASRGLLPSDRATQRKIASAWRARAKSEDLSAGHLTQMVAKLENKEASPEDQVASEFMVLLTKNAWGSSPPFRSHQDSYAQDVGAVKLTQKAEVTSGALSGTWSGLAAFLVNRLRQAGRGGAGVPSYDLEKMLGKEAAEKPGPLLASAIGFQWRPGVSIDGLVSLALLGRGSGAVYEKESERRREFERAAARLGVLDPYGWAREHASSSMAFTSVFMGRGATAAFDALFAAWERALSVCPDLLEETPEAKRDLLAALTGNFTMADESRTKKAAQLTAPWYPAFDYRSTSTFPDLGRLDSSEVSLALEVALATNSSEWLRGIGDGIDHLSKEDLDRIDEWAALIRRSKNRKKPEEMEALQVRANEKRMLDSVPEAQPNPIPSKLRARF